MSSSQIITIAQNAVTAKLIDATAKVKLEVQQILSYQVDGAENTNAFKKGEWDGYNSFFNYRDATFPAGFSYHVAAALSRRGYTVRHLKRPLPRPLGPEDFWNVDGMGRSEKYEYQIEVTEKLLKYGQIIAQVATGGGKSRICRLAYSRIQRPTLFLTTRSVLMYQMKDAVEKDLKCKVSVIGDGKFGTDDSNEITRFTVAMVQTLSSRLEKKTVEEEFKKLTDSIAKKHVKLLNKMEKELEKADELHIRSHKMNAAQATEYRISRVKPNAAELKKFEKRLEEETPDVADIRAKAERKVYEQEMIRQQTIRLLEKFEFVILEEAHESSGNSYYDVMSACKNATYRLALTATPFMRDSQESNMRLMACSGPVAIKVSEKMLIDRGILAKPYFKYVRFQRPPPNLKRGMGWQTAYKAGIVENAQRNAMVVQEVKRAAKHGLPSLVLIQHVEHGVEVTKLIEEAGLRVAFLRGENDQEERRAALDALGRGEIDVIVGSTIVDVGVDVPGIGLVVLAGGGKAQVALRQRIGRGLRAKKNGPNIAFIVDFEDAGNEYLQEHAMTRRAIVEGTPGFAEGILSAGADFDYSVFEGNA